NSFLQFSLKTHLDLPTTICRKKFLLRCNHGIPQLPPNRGFYGWEYTPRPSVRGRLKNPRSDSSSHRCETQTGSHFDHSASIAAPDPDPTKCDTRPPQRRQTPYQWLLPCHWLAPSCLPPSGYRHTSDAGAR